MEYDPDEIQMEVFPRDELDIDALISELESAGVIMRYEIDGVPLIWIRNFVEHQNPHRNEKPSALPPHPDETRKVETLPEHSSNYPRTHAESVTLNIETVTLNQEQAERNGTEMRKRSGTERNGKPVPVGKILRAPPAADTPIPAETAPCGTISPQPIPGPHQGKKITVDRILAASHDPPEAAPYWTEVCQRLTAVGEIEILRDALSRVENEDGFKKPAAYLNRQCNDALKRHGRQMPKPWKQPTNQESRT